MNRIISLITLLASACSLAAQITVTNAGFPAAGDTLRIAFDTTSAGITVSPPGGNQTWDFSAVTPAFIRTVPIRPAAEGPQAAAFPTATLVAPAGPNGYNYFRVTPSAYELIGYTGTDPIGLGLDVATPFNPPVLERRAPMNFFDINQTNGALLVAFAASELPQFLLSLFPVVPDSVRLRVAISRVDVVDGWGTVIIPGGSYQALRERRTQITDTRVEVKVGILPWVDVTALIPLPDAGLGRDTSLNYYFFSNTAKEPIAVVEADHVTGEVLGVQYKFNSVSSTGPDISVSAPLAKVFPNPAGEQARLELVNLPFGVYDLRVFHIDGRQAWRQRIPVGASLVQVDLDLVRFRPGMHVFSLSEPAGNVVLTGKLVVAAHR